MLGPPPHPLWVQNAQIPGDTGGNAHQCRPGKRELTQLKLRAGGTRSKSALQTQCNAAFMRHKSPQKGIKGGSSCHQRSRCIRSLQRAPGPRRSQAPSVPDPLQVQPSRGTPRRVSARGPAPLGAQAGRTLTRSPGAPRRGVHLPHAAAAPAGKEKPPGRAAPDPPLPRCSFSSSSWRSSSRASAGRHMVLAPSEAARRVRGARSRRAARCPVPTAAGAAPAPPRAAAAP